ncbi:hypothetical protein [Novosphingobium resinovorum]|uniref:hypothetical protein n=1 Tax=Novosphingobium resinovorum TaxID=158500 RepID=UPI002ED285B5|nr:hypothetical protein [Novosphingobium resinovorum]
MRSIPHITAIAALALALPAAVVAAPPAETPSSSTPEPGNPEARREALNSAEADMAQRQLDRNAASQQQYDMALAQAQSTADREAGAYSDALRQHDVAVDNYRADRKQWEMKNPACWNGNAVKCPAEPGVDAPEPGAPGG